MVKKKEDTIAATFEAGEVQVNRRSLAHRDDIIVSTAELANLIDITPPRCAELFLAADVECVGYRARTKLYWMGESLARIGKHYAPAKLKKGEKKKHSQVENERVSALEDRKIRLADIKIAKEEREWIPVDEATHALSNFSQQARSIFTSCIPLMRQKFGEKVPADVFQSMNDHLSDTYNMTCNLQIETRLEADDEPEPDE